MSATVRYTLVSNGLTEEESFRAQVVMPRSATIEDVADHIVEQGSTVTRSDILGVLEGYRKAVLHLLLVEGVRVNTPLASFTISIKGAFVDEEDSFDPVRHHVVGKVNPGALLRQEVERHSQVERLRVPIRRPRPLGYRDFNTGERNGALTPGGVGKLTGDWLKLDPGDENQGITFIAGDGTETRVAVVAESYPTKLLFQVPPDLAPGGYQVRVRTIDGDDVLQKDKVPITLTA